MEMHEHMRFYLNRRDDDITGIDTVFTGIDIVFTRIDTAFSH